MVEGYNKKMKNTKFNFQELVNNYSDMIYNIAIRYLGNKEDAEDIVQETFMRYIKSIKEKGEFDTEDHIKYWLIRVSLNLCNNEINSAKHNRNIFLEESKIISYKDTKIDYNDFVNKLSSKYRNVFELFYIEDMKISDISKILSISESNVKTRLKRARDKIKKILQLGGEEDNE